MSFMSVIFAILATAFVAGGFAVSGDAGGCAIFAACFGAACGFTLSRSEER